MTTTINENTYFARVMDPQPADTCSIPESTDALSEAEFLATANSILKDGFKGRQDLDYVAGRLTELIQANPGIAQKNHLPTDQPTIKTEIVEGYFKKHEKSFFKDYLEWSQKKDQCLMDNVGTFIDAGIECATTAAVAVAGKVPKTVGVASVLKECIEVVKPFIECHTKPGKTD